MNDYCYLVSTSVKSWSQARAYCHSLDADLVKINSAQENEFVLKLVRKEDRTPKQVWLGLRWYSTNFNWYDNSVPVYSNWAPGEPNGKAREPCVHMYTAQPDNKLPGRASGYWNDIPCHVLSGWPNGIVCKKLP